jgi:hypothetical protein
MKSALADRLCRALVGCYPPRWKRRYAAEMLDVLDQHRTGARTILSLAGGALTTHLDPGYRMEIRAMPRDQARPRRLAEFEGGDPTTISPDGRTVATSAFGGQPILWNVTRPARAARIATLLGSSDYFTAFAFSPPAHLPAGVTFHCALLVYRLAGPGHSVRVTGRPASWPAPGTPAEGAAPPIRATPAARPRPTQSPSPRTAIP